MQLARTARVVPACCGDFCSPLLQVARSIDLVEVPACHPLFLVGDEPDFMYVLIEGQMHIFEPKKGAPFSHGKQRTLPPRLSLPAQRLSRRASIIKQRMSVTGTDRDLAELRGGSKSPSPLPGPKLASNMRCPFAILRNMDALRKTIGADGPSRAAHQRHRVTDDAATPLAAPAAAAHSREAMAADRIAALFRGALVRRSIRQGDTSHLAEGPRTGPPKQDP